MTDTPLVAWLVRRLDVADYTPTRTPMAGSVTENEGTPTSDTPKAKLVRVTILSIPPGKATA